MSHPHCRRHILREGAAAGAALALIGCAATTDLAPVPAAESATTQEGRRTFLTCAGSCHSPEPVMKCSRAEWLGRHVPAMSVEAKLTPAKRAALEAYLHAVCPR